MKEILLYKIQVKINLFYNFWNFKYCAVNYKRIHCYKWIENINLEKGFPETYFKSPLKF
jgi:hypothetical protein